MAPAIQSSHSGGNLASDSNNALVRPTEAQLRWAQFHHKRQAVGVRESIQIMYQHPETVDEVPGALPDDGNTTTTSNNSNSSSGENNPKDKKTESRRAQRRKRRPQVSRGRRALLRVSQRNYWKRRQAIEEHGFLGMLTRDSMEGSSAEEDELLVGPTGGEDEQHENALNEIFMVKSSRRRRRRRPRKRRPGSTTGSRYADDEQFQRFQAACHAMMMNLAAPPKHSIIIPTRIWTRTVDPAAALDDQYLDPKWGIRRRIAPGETSDLHHHHLGISQGLAPLDRGASWMMHLPKAVPVARENPYYHPDQEFLPGTPGSEGGASHHSAASTLALQAPGVHKFNRLVEVVQQRMIQKQQRKLQLALRRKSRDRPTPKMKLRPTFSTSSSQDQDENNASYSYEGDNEEYDLDNSLDISMTSPRRYGGTDRARKVHYIPRMHLRDFEPTNETSNPDQLNDKANHGETKKTMKLRNFPGTGTPTTEDRRKSRARELAQSFEATNSGKDQPRRLSKTQQMAQSMEHAHLDPKSKYPKMRLRPSLDFANSQDREDEEKKFPEDDNKPQRLSHAFSEKFDDRYSELEINELNSQMSSLPTQQQRSVPHSEAPNGDASHGGQDGHELVTGSQDAASPHRHQSTPERILQDPPKRRPHALSDQFLQAMQASQQPPEKPQLLIKPLPPGECCSRCARKSTGSVHSNELTQRPAGDFLSKVTTGPAARVSDFFSNLRRTNASAESESNGRVSSGSHRASDFFGGLRHLNANTPGRESAIDRLQESNEPFEESDFFAQVREMIANDDDDEATAAQRVSDFFAQVRQMNSEDENHDENNDGDDCLLCEDCQVQDIEDSMERASVSLSPDKRTHFKFDLAQSMDGESPEPVMDKGRSSQFPGIGVHASNSNTEDEVKSEHSAISDLWNRGRSSLNSFATSLTAISEKNANRNQAKTRASAASMPGRVGGFLQMLERKGKPEDQNAEVQPMTQNPENPLSDIKSPTRQSLEYNASNDMEAMAAYRKSQESKRLSVTPEDASSNSSFVPLPEGIRQVVKQLGSSPHRQPKTSDSQANAGAYREAALQAPFPEAQFGREHGDHLGIGGALSRPSTSSPGRGSVVSSSIDHISPDKYKAAHGKIIQNSPLLRGGGNEIIDTDGTTSDVSHSGINPRLLATLMLSPDILQQRLHQAIRAVEERHWEQVTYLINANPWLAEMCEVTTKQYLLHKLAFFGITAPQQLCEELVEKFPAAVYKFDEDGNVPLHLAAAAGHLKMIELLGEKFEGGASIRNEDGMLPLHFTIASYGVHEGPYGEDKEDDDDDNPSPLRVIKAVLAFFPKAVAISDNDGNLPIHVAAECLRGGLGVDVIYILLDEAERQLADPYGARFFNRVTLEELVNDDISAATDRESEIGFDEDIHCTMVKNSFGETPLLSAIRNYRGWDVIEALVSGPGGEAAALFKDADGNNALHLLVSEFQDPVAAMSVLKVAPKAATMRNNEGMLPIECACLQLMPEEVIISIALVDLPFDIDEKDNLKHREGFGESWWFLVCECDDHYVAIVQEIILVCTFRQVRELCFMERGSSQYRDAVLSRATPKCQQVLKHALRFLGRFEFIGDTAVKGDPSIGLKVFEALDFDGAIGNEEGRRVTLKCYSMAGPFNEETRILEEYPLDHVYVEEVLTFVDGNAGSEEQQQRDDIRQQFCISIELPQVTLDRVVQGMVKKGGYQNDKILRKKYAAKMCAVLRLIAKALRHLHKAGVIHGDVCMENCGKFEHAWKLLGRMEVQPIGKSFNLARFHQSFPPEALQLDETEGTVYDSDVAAISFRPLASNVATDIWAFGKLAYETLVGKALVEFDPAKKTFDDTVSLLEIMEWDQSNMETVFKDLLDSGVTESCADLVTSCLFPNPEDRIGSMDEILEHEFWKDMRQFRERSSPMKRRSDAASSVFSESPQKSIFSDTASAVDTSHEIELY